MGERDKMTKGPSRCETPGRREWSHTFLHAQHSHSGEVSAWVEECHALMFDAVNVGDRDRVLELSNLIAAGVDRADQLCLRKEFSVWLRGVKIGEASHQSPPKRSARREITVPSRQRSRSRGDTLVSSDEEPLVSSSRNPVACTRFTDVASIGALLDEFTNVGSLPGATESRVNLRLIPLGVRVPKLPFPVNNEGWWTLWSSI